jgi:hypothetical protein
MGNVGERPSEGLLSGSLLALRAGISVPALLLYTPAKKDTYEGCHLINSLRWTQIKYKIQIKMETTHCTTCKHSLWYTYQGKQYGLCQNPAAGAIDIDKNSPGCYLHSSKQGQARAPIINKITELNDAKVFGQLQVF